VIPEVAAREQLRYMIPVLKDALEKANLSFSKTIPPDIDAIAVTYGPGLIGSLLVGVETAKTLSYVWNKPLIPVNHLYGHIYANWIGDETPQFPALALVVSGGHTDLVVMKDHENLEWIGGSRDDAAGEAFDKIGRLLGLPYPAGPAIEKAAQKGTPKRFSFPRPMMHSDDFDFSFSGLKTAVLYEVRTLGKLDEQTVADIALETENAMFASWSQNHQGSRKYK
jgi:N6-L-threonylcarbamoyladenine synthase